MIKIGLLGAKGRMGQSVTLLLATEFSSVATLSAGVSRGDSLDPLFQTDVVIDFSSPTAFLTLAKKVLSHNKGVPHIMPAFVVGSTGWTPEGEKTLEELGSRAPVLMASNFSTGVSALARILQQASPLLEKLGYTPVIVEAHHEHKVDSPSGTALSLQRAIRPSNPSSVQTHSIRAGEVIGDHEITFYGKNDQITLRHSAKDRSIFARGAIQAALWLAQNRSIHSPQGLLSMEHYFHALTERNPTHE
jgi:4-hydroxy-tetrahydrodipicolinate reductase